MNITSVKQLSSTTKLNKLPIERKVKVVAEEIGALEETKRLVKAIQNEMPEPNLEAYRSAINKIKKGLTTPTILINSNALEIREIRNFNFLDVILEVKYIFPIDSASLEILIPNVEIYSKSKSLSVFHCDLLRTMVQRPYGIENRLRDAEDAAHDYLVSIGIDSTNLPLAIVSKKISLMPNKTISQKKKAEAAWARFHVLSKIKKVSFIGNIDWESIQVGYEIGNSINRLEGFLKSFGSGISSLESQSKNLIKSMKGYNGREASKKRANKLRDDIAKTISKLEKSNPKVKNSEIIKQLIQSNPNKVGYGKDNLKKLVTRIRREEIKYQ